MLTPEVRRMITNLETRLAQMERERRQYWAVPIVGGSSSPPAIYVVAGGKALADWGSDGGRRKTSALLASDLPPGTGGTPGSTVQVPSNPIPAGLPDGICVGTRIYDGATAFILCDSTCYIASDLIQGDVIIAGEAVDFTVPSGGVNYVYRTYRSYGRR